MRGLIPVMWVLAGCGTAPITQQLTETTSVTTVETVRAVVATISSDYSTGSFATVSGDGWSVEDELFTTSGDAVVVADDGFVVQINRYGYDTVRLYQPGEWLAPIWEVNVGEVANPHDAEVCGGKLFISLYDRDFVGIYSLEDGAEIGAVDLTEFDDGDGSSPEGSTLVELNGKLYLGMNRLDRSKGWADVGGAVAEIDCEQEVVTASWFVGGNTVISPWQGREALVVLAEPFGQDAGGVYGLDPATGDLTLLYETITEHPVSCAAVGDYAITVSLAADLSYYSLSCLDLSLGEERHYKETESYLTGVFGAPDGSAWVTAGVSWLSESALDGVMVWDVASCEELTREPIEFSLYPSSVGFY